MFETREFKDSTVEAATAKGLKEMGLTPETATVEVKSYGGIFSRACVAITPKEPAAEEPAPAMGAAEDAAEEKIVSAEAEKEVGTVGVPDEVQVKSANAVKAFVEGLLEKMSIGAEVVIDAEADELRVDICGSEAGGVIGYRGEVLDAVQYFALLVANKEERVYGRVTVDAEHYRAKREETLTVLAKRLEQKAMRSGRKVSLEPMNPFERRVIHTALQDSKNVRTESEGEGRFRHVVILPKRESGERVMTYGKSNEFRRKGMGKTRSFGDKRRKF